METRPLGRTGHRSTILALGGAVLMGNLPRSEVNALVERALDCGVNHIDVAPTYGDAELGLRKWVKEYRGNIFLACKTMKRTQKDAAEELRTSLERLQTDHFDLYQLHQVDKPDELETALGPGGAMQAILEAKKQGLVKYIGITSHKPTIIMKALEDYEFDTVLLPVNCVLKAHLQPENNYEPVLTLAKKRGTGVIAMKAIAKGPWPDENRPYDTWYAPFENQREIYRAFRFTLSQDVATATTTSDARLASIMIDAAEHFTPMSTEEQRSIVSEVSLHEPLFPASSIP